MAKVAARDTNITINNIALEDDVTSYTLDVKQEVQEVTSFADVGPRKVAGNYDFSLKLDGKPDFTAAQSDATLFAMLGSNGVTMGVDPTGVAVDANNPHYDATLVLLESYSIKGSTGGPVEFSASMAGGSALARSVA